MECHVKGAGGWHPPSSTTCCSGLCLVLNGSKFAEFQPSLSLEEVISLLFLFYFFTLSLESLHFPRGPSVK